ncbi:MAG: hypothetical protein Q8N57_00010 [bacterium]|nr:hypothetical protein [bacterium]
MMRFKSWNKKTDLIILLLINIFAVAISFLTHANFLFSTLLFLGLPSLYLCLKEKKYLKKVLLASISFGILFSFCFDFLAELNKAWSWNGGLWFGKIIGIVQIDVMVWFFLWILHIFIFYEHFIDKSKLKSIVSKRGKTSFILGIALVFILMLIYKYAPNVLLIQKAYLFLCLIPSVPFVLMLIFKSKIVWHTLRVIPYFFFVYLSHEITALHLLQWNFPGDYIGWVHLLGVSFPIEEMFFWILLSSLIGSVYYEVIFDNSHN